MKSKYILLMATLIAVGLAACSKKPEPVIEPVVQEEPAPVEEVAIPEEPQINQDSLDALEAARLEAARKRLQELMDRLMADDVYFDFDRSELTAEAKDLLNQVGAILTEEPRFTITVEGHTDERGTEDYNMTLGSTRATKVKEFLSAYGISGDRMETISYGEEKPKVEGSSEEAYAKNRRANFRVNVK
ncbi:MAG: OmpA family protein [Fibrobacter sp.]|jgi:peptidoglycan-associated lipoprotein|nr:OmpA family protein [Fibrobacter sp.]